jgi:hypothetical protein
MSDQGAQRCVSGKARRLAAACTLWVCLLVATFLVPSMAGKPPPPTPEELPRLADSLASRLQGVKVPLPDGSEILLLEPGASDEAPPPDALLTTERLERCLRTVARAESWPAAWLVVQEQHRDFDLVMRIALDADGEVATPDFLFVVPRRDWEIGDVKSVVRQATGRKPPRAGIGNLVIQGFSGRVVTTYVYEAPPTGEPARGLAALLPEGAMIREAKAVELFGGRRYTLALVLLDATFHPSDCADCSAALFGHADSGRVLLVLAGERQVVDRLDLTAELPRTAGGVRLPRYRCEPGDADSPPSIEALQEREPVTLLELADLDGDGHPHELELPLLPIDCVRHFALTVRIVSDGPALEVVALAESTLR